MSETVEKQSVVSAESYDELNNMLTCEDEASVNVAMTILEQCDYKKSELYILCLLKKNYSQLFGSKGPKVEANYPILFKKITDSLRDSATDISTLSFRKIFEITKERGVKEEMKFMLSIFTNELIGLLRDHNLEFLDELDVILWPKGQPHPQDARIAELEEELKQLKSKQVND